MHIPNSRLATHGSATLGMRSERAGEPTGEWAPHGVSRGGIVHLAFTLVWSTALLSRSGTAVADEPDHFIAVAAVGSAVRIEGEWDGAYGGELGVGQMRGDSPLLSAWAASFGALGFTARSGGRLWSELTLGTRWPTGTLVGLGAGPAI